ncbi:MAG: TonB-dependent receptor [Bryobacteraceae bacterium]|nr:TonB-dependent receptor [Bryobacteraceae bacterium]
MGNARVRCLTIVLLAAGVLLGGEHRGVVKLGTQPIPGATVTAQNRGKKVVALTDIRGSYVFPDLADGTWKVKVEMRGFAPIEREVQSPGAAEWNLTILPLARIADSGASAQVRTGDAPTTGTRHPAKIAMPAATNTTSGFQSTKITAANTPVTAADVSPEVARRAEDGFLVNGSVSNAASSPFSQLPAFGNNRAPGKWPYHGNLGLMMDNSPADARPYSLTGQNTPRLAYNKMTGFLSLGGPIRIPYLLHNGPQFTLNYQWTRNRDDAAQSALMPTLAERAGDFSQSLTPLGQPVQMLDPATGSPVAGNQIPLNRISPQAQALLRFYPLANFTGQSGYNFQVPIVSNLHQDSLQLRAVQQIGRKDNLSGTLQWQSTRTDNPNLFGFLATGSQLTAEPTINWRHTFSSRFFVTLGYQFSRNSALTVPYFSKRRNVSADAGISGNDQDPLDWGPPTLTFANGVASLGEAQYSSTRNQTHGLSAEVFSERGLHSFTYGVDFQRHQWNALSQQDPRGTFTFTGAAAGSDLAGFLFGVPDTASIAFGNADKYFRANSWDAYISDDWRFRSGFSLTLGVRYEYNAPVSELYGRLVNLAVADSFASAVPIVERSAGSLIRPDRNNFAPRIGFAWRPLPASTMVVRGGYGVYYDHPLYQSIALQMAQQAPLSISLRVQNSAANPLTLADGFRGSPNVLNTTFGIDPAFRTGYAQNWQLSVQRDLPFALQMVGTYMGIKGTRAVQQFLPNTFPAGAVNPCEACPSGFSYMTSNGDSTRQAGTVQLRRRLRRGLAAEAQYTWAKALDDAALGGSNFLIAQNWLDLSAERGRSNFDQRHVVTFQAQYTTGAGSGGFLTTRRIGALFREWTVTTQLNYGTGLPLTPTSFSSVAGTGVTGSIRANYTGADPYDALAGLHLNPAAYTAPAAGQWGNAGRNSITGPAQFSLNASAGRTFRWGDRLNADLRVDATNVLNHPVFPSWNTVITSAQFGLPNPAGAMRALQTSLRVRF